jgi:transcriptional regulator with XRE-family HTH domain
VSKGVDDEVARIADRIRRWREEKGLTRQLLGERSGLAVSTVHKIETGQMIPSIAVLLKLAHGLGRRPTEIIEDAESDDAVAMMRASERKPIRFEGRISVERLSGDLLDPVLEMWRVSIHPGMSSGRRPIRNDGEALIVCEKGRLAVRVGDDEYTLGAGVRVGDDEYTLGAGDALHFKANIPHSWRNEGRAVTQFTITGTLSKEIRALLHQRVAQAAQLAAE